MSVPPDEFPDPEDEEPQCNEPQPECRECDPSGDYQQEEELDERQVTEEISDDE